MPLINCKVELSLDWYAKCIIIMGGTDATFVIRDAKLYVPNVTLKTEDNAKLSKILHEGFKRLVYWNRYKIIFRDYSANENIRERLDSSLRGVGKLFVVAYQHGDEIMLMKKHLINIFFQKLQLENKTLKLMEEIFMIKKLMLQLNNTIK